MSEEETSIPGPWRTDKVPYLKKIMDTYSDPYIEKIFVLKPTQIGGTEAVINMVCYTIDQAPARILYTLSDDKAVGEFSDMRLQRVLRGCECFKGKYHYSDSNKGMLKFLGGFCKMASARVPSALASWSVPKIIMDEIDKYPRWTSKEADPLKLAEERTKNWPNKRKQVFLSTPTLKDGNIYKGYQSADIRYRFHVPCPFCGHYQTLDWQRVRFDSTADMSVIEYNTYIECCACGEHITDVNKPAMLSKGRWVAENMFSGKPRSVGFALNSLYSPWVSFGQMAVEFMRSKDDPAKLMNFINSWLGEPWESKAAKMDIEIVLQRRTDLEMNVVPSWCRVLAGGVDCQQGYFYWNIRAWGTKMTSQLVAYGRAMSFQEISEIMDQMWPDEDGELKWQVNMYCVDSGYNSDAVYEYCQNNFGVAIPVKGSSTARLARVSLSNVECKNKGLMTLQIAIVDTNQFKDMIAYRLNKPIGTGAFMFNADTDREYAEQITSEQKVIDDKSRREVWKPKTSAKQNHWWDCEVYNSVAAELCHIRNITDEKPIEEELPIKLVDEPDRIPEPNFEL